MSNSNDKKTPSPPTPPKAPPIRYVKDGGIRSVPPTNNGNGDKNGKQ